MALILGAVPCWPWLLTARLPEYFYARQYVFSAAALGIACAFIVPIATGSDFEIGLLAHNLLCAFRLGSLSVDGTGQARPLALVLGGGGLEAMRQEVTEVAVPIPS